MIGKRTDRSQSVHTKRPSTRTGIRRILFTHSHVMYTRKIYRNTSTSSGRAFRGLFHTVRPPACGRANGASAIGSAGSAVRTAAGPFGPSRNVPKTTKRKPSVCRAAVRSAVRQRRSVGLSGGRVRGTMRAARFTIRIRSDQTLELSRINNALWFGAWLFALQPLHSLGFVHTAK